MASTSNQPQSFVAITGSSTSSCGYCHASSDSSHSFGLWAYRLTPSVYQNLIDHGWRRSGKYLYKPTLTTTCCPAYTIRLNAGSSSVSKGQKKVLKKMKRYLNSGKGIVAKDEENEMSKVGPREQFMIPASDIPTAIDTAAWIHADTARSDVSNPKNKTRFEQESAQHLGSTISVLIHETESIANQHSHQLKVVLEVASFTQATFELYKKYQIAVHNDPPSRLNPEQFTQFLVDTPICTELIPETDFKSTTSQLACWNDPTHSIQPQPSYGSFHQKYYMDDKLIAVAVLDILPRCVSSVYFMYDPAFGFLSLGTYSALREIALTKWLSDTMPRGLDYYYMGYYIHSCIKMRYKAAYKPSQILCPETYKWVDLSQATRLLDLRKDTALVDCKNKTEGDTEDAAIQPRPIRDVLHVDIPTNVIEKSVALVGRKLVPLNCRVFIAQLSNLFYD
ncbi:Arginyl-tRNA--protein transferase 1, variant 2 [Batrachochytrium dendrobatidis]|nr:Arginyl-tRNA--protein transferase 1, variant 2 [Batrachochytrium dendrobatidis]